MGKVDVELDGHFTDILTLAVVLLPDVFEVGTGDEHQVEVADDLIGVANDAAHACGMLHEVQFIDLMIVDGIGKLLLTTVRDVKHILAHQG